MPRHPPDPNTLKAVLDFARNGTPASEIAELAGVNENTIRNWIKRYGGGLKSGATVGAPALMTAYSGVKQPDEPAPPPDIGPEPTPPKDNTDLLAMACYQRDCAMYASLKAQRTGNMTAAQRHSRDAANLLPTIARLQKAQAGDADAIHISKADIARDREALRDVIKKLLDRPLLCAHCGRALSVKLAEDE